MAPITAGDGVNGWVPRGSGGMSGPRQEGVQPGEGNGREKLELRSLKAPCTKPTVACWPDEGQTVLEQGSEIRPFSSPHPSSALAFLPARLWGLKGELLCWVEGPRKGESPARPPLPL